MAGLGDSRCQLLPNLNPKGPNRLLKEPGFESQRRSPWYPASLHWRQGVCSLTGGVGGGFFFSSPSMPSINHTRYAMNTANTGNRQTLGIDMEIGLYRVAFFVTRASI